MSKSGKVRSVDDIPSLESQTELFKTDKAGNQVLQAVCVVKTGDLLCESYALTIVDGRVTNASPLTRAEDLPIIAIGLAQKLLWSQMRVNRCAPIC